MRYRWKQQKLKTVAKSQRRYYNFNSTRQPAVGNVRYPFFRKITPIVADSITLSAGVSASVLSDLQTENDGNIYTIAEVAATPGFRLIIKFADVSFFNFLRVKAVYDGSTSHAAIAQLYNWIGAVYETKNCIEHNGNYSAVLGEQVINCYENKIQDSAKYINAGAVWLRIDHPMGGNPAHDIHIDYASLY